MVASSNATCKELQPIVTEHLKNLFEKLPNEGESPFETDSGMGLS